jgi:uncharacterized protein
MVIMLIDFREISPSGLNVESDEEIKWLDTEQNDPLRDIYTFDRPFKVSAHLDKAQENVFLTGSFSGTVTAHCVRCLKTFEVNLAEPFRLTLMPRGADDLAGEGSERELEADDLDLAYYEHERVDLGEVVSEQVLLMLGLYPHCRPDCKGLCPVCGVDRNENACSCAESQIEPRWAALKKFKTG